MFFKNSYFPLTLFFPLALCAGLFMTACSTPTVPAAHTFTISSKLNVVRISNDSTLLLTGTLDGNIQIFDLDTGETKTKFSTQTSLVDAWFYQDTNHLITWEEGSIVRTWDLLDLSHVPLELPIIHTGPSATAVTSLLVAPSGPYVATEATDSKGHILTILFNAATNSSQTFACYRQPQFSLDGSHILLTHTPLQLDGSGCVANGSGEATLVKLNTDPTKFVIEATAKDTNPSDTSVNGIASFKRVWFLPDQIGILTLSEKNAATDWLCGRKGSHWENLIPCLEIPSIYNVQVARSGKEVWLQYAGQGWKGRAFVDPDAGLSLSSNSFELDPGGEVMLSPTGSRWIVGKWSNIPQNKEKGLWLLDGSNGSVLTPLGNPVTVANRNYWSYSANGRYVAAFLLLQGKVVVFDLMGL